jgi:hypothetical protein
MDSDPSSPGPEGRTIPIVVTKTGRAAELVLSQRRVPFSVQASN